MGNSDGKPWVLRQLGGARKELRLEGWSGPFGRPRQGAIVEDELNMRHQTTRYPDSYSAPTRHVFGPEFPPWEIHGRWMDKVLGPDGAQNKVREVRAFILDSQQVAISWGDAIAVEGWIENLKTGWESSREVAWKLKIEIDTDKLAWQPPVVDTVSLSKLTKTLTGLYEVSLSIPMPPKVALRIGILDALDNAISAVTGAIGAVASIAGQIRDFSNAALGDINRLRQGIKQAQTAVATMQSLVAPWQGVVAQTADDALAVTGGDTADRDDYRARQEAVLAKIAAQLAEIDAQAETASARAQGAVTAQAGDTWEILSVRHYGDTTHADAIRALNGIKYGLQPVAGATYHYP